MITDTLEKIIQGKGIRVGFMEGADPRVLEASYYLKLHDTVQPVLLGNEDEIRQSAKEHGYNLEGIEIISSSSFKELDQLALRMVSIRRGKWDFEECKEMLLNNVSYFGAMLVEQHYLDGLLGGCLLPTPEVLRPTLQLVKTAPQERMVSSCFLMRKDNQQYIMADCSINIDPSVDDIIEITLQTVKTAREIFDIEPKVALLSYSSFGSAGGESAEKMAEATKRLKRMPLDFDVDGEMQFDCAIAPEVASLKASESKVAGQANVFIFPNLSSSNIGHKIASRLGGWEAIGPVIQGLSAPISDLSRGVTAKGIYKMAIVIAYQKYKYFSEK
ncbi:phosphotransacetylase [Floccifex sp.]|uniref:phosphotransacetylase n=1 Tax=Floccifex sp. TaxID=2815810 RepID=UPI002A752293|nr:phosphotransacetylase [Floccifex sp.]MDD7281890.1 phosphotransacetylase [Erysipelotrichaceae bacterium]MDY2958599.1 phosphotransacetylase [Floccifex sp.]